MESLTPYQRQVLVTIGKNCHPNSKRLDRQWTRPLNFPVVEAAVRELQRHEMIARHHGRVRPTWKGWDQIDSEKLFLKYERISCIKGPFIGGRPLLNIPIRRGGMLPKVTGQAGRPPMDALVKRAGEFVVKPSDGRKYVLRGGYWIEKYPEHYNQYSTTRT